LKGTCGVSSSGVMLDYNMHGDAGKARRTLVPPVASAVSWPMIDNNRGPAYG